MSPLEGLFSCRPLLKQGQNCDIPVASIVERLQCKQKTSHWSAEGEGSSCEGGSEYRVQYTDSRKFIELKVLMSGMNPSW